jgi:hypothetical protein
VKPDKELTIEYTGERRAIAIPLPGLLFVGALSARARSGARGESHE